MVRVGGVSTPADFLALLVRNDNDCLIWPGPRTGPHGTVSYQGEAMKTHRLAWELLRGPIPDGMLVRSTCGAPLCANVSHLFLGTRAESIGDARTKRRWVPKRLAR